MPTTTTTTPLGGGADGSSTNPVDPLVGKPIGQESSLSNWAGPYVTDMLGKGWALSEQPYQQYQGPLTAGASDLQQQAFQGIAGLTLPQDMTTAAQQSGEAAQRAGSLNYAPQSYANTFNPTGNYAPSAMQNQFSAPGAYETGQFADNHFQTPGNLYRAGDINTNRFTDQGVAKSYMNPYLQNALNPQIDEARRQAEIQRIQDAGRLTQAGAYGGSRQAIMESEGNRNLMSNLANITGTGYRDAYDKAGQMFTSDDARNLQGQTLRESSRQAEGQQALSAAQMAAQYGLSADQAREASRQFGANQAMTAAQMAAQYGLSGEQARETSRQFGASQGMTAAQLMAQYGLSADQANEMSRQFSQDQAMRNAQTNAQYGLASLQTGQGDRQFGAQYGLDAIGRQLQGLQQQSGISRDQLQAQMDIANNQGIMGGLQRGIESEGIAADRQAFDDEWQFPYKQVQYMQSLLDGMPLAAQNATYQQPGALSEFGGITGGIMSIFEDLFPSAPTTPNPTTPTPTDNNGTGGDLSVGTSGGANVVDQGIDFGPYPA